MANRLWRMALSRNGSSNSDGSFDWSDALIDSFIVGMINLFATAAGLGASGLLAEPVKSALALAISFGSSFFGFLAIKRGLKQPSSP